METFNCKIGLLRMPEADKKSDHCEKSRKNRM